MKKKLKKKLKDIKVKKFNITTLLPNLIVLD